MRGNMKMAPRGAGAAAAGMARRPAMPGAAAAGMARRPARPMPEEMVGEEMAVEEMPGAMKRGGKVKKMKSGGFVKAADGIAKKGQTRGKVC